jgi:hypothetical protein
MDDRLGLAVALRHLPGDGRVRALDLVGHRLADIVQEGRALGRLHARPELGGHHTRQVRALERVLEDVLAVARPVAEAAEDLDELLVHLPAVRLEDGLLPGLADEVVDLRLRPVVHLLDAGRVDAAVLDELDQRQLGHLAADSVERREHDRLRGVVDDEVDAGEVLEGADVPALAADDPPLHVVRGQLDDRDRRLRGVARRHPLKRVGDEIPRTTLGVRAGFLLELAHHAGQVVAHELLRALQHLRLRLLDGEARDPLQLLQLVVLGLLGLLLELLEVRLPVQEPLLAPLELGELAVDLLLFGDDALFDLGDLCALALQLLLDVCPELERLLACLDLGFAADGVRGPRRVRGRTLRLGRGGGDAPRDEHSRPDETAREQAEGDPQNQEDDGSSHARSYVQPVGTALS